jgi:hypothetical protein
VDENIEEMFIKVDFQLPLSGSLAVEVLDEVVDELCQKTFQLPLSGSPNYAAILSWFQRFHLSTPSLGITGADGICGIHQGPLSTPSLGITCRELENHLRMLWYFFKTFQLPLSGSLAKKILKFEPFPYPFNSLSRDHRARFRDFPSLRGVLPRHLFAQMISEATIWIYRFDPL